METKFFPQAIYRKKLRVSLYLHTPEVAKYELDLISIASISTKKDFVK